MLVDKTYGLPIDPTKQLIFVFLINVLLSNPNGDPGIGGAPRRNRLGHGWMTDANIKRIIRDYAAERLAKNLFYEREGNLDTIQDRFAQDATEGGKRAKKKGDKSTYDVDRFYRELWDARTLGAMPTRFAGNKAPFQFGIATSIDPVVMERVNFSATTVRIVKNTNRSTEPASTEPSDTEVDGTDIPTPEDEGRRSTPFNSYEVVSYGLYRGGATFNPFTAAKVGTQSQDMADLFEALIEGWAMNRAAHRTGVDLRHLYVFERDPRAGNEPESVLAERVKVTRTNDGLFPRGYDDYEVSVDTENLPKGTTLYRWVDGVMTTTVGGDGGHQLAVAK